MAGTKTHLQMCEATYASLGEPLHMEIVSALRSGSALAINMVASKVARLAKTATSASVFGAVGYRGPTVAYGLALKTAAACLAGVAAEYPVTMRGGSINPSEGFHTYTPSAPQPGGSSVGYTWGSGFRGAAEGQRAYAGPSVGSFAHGGRGDNFPNCIPQPQLWPIGWPRYWQLGGVRY